MFGMEGFAKYGGNTVGAWKSTDAHGYRAARLAWKMGSSVH